MTGQRTATPFHLTERHKARARLVLLSAIGIACPPLAGVSSTVVWVFYAAFLITYSLWALRLVRSFSGDRRLGYLLTLTDTAVMLPLLAWASSAAMQVVLALFVVAGLIATYSADRSRKRAALAPDESQLLRPWAGARASGGAGVETALERGIRVRLRVLETTRMRFALVVLRIVRFDEIRTYYGEAVADHLIGAVARRGLRLCS